MEEFLLVDGYNIIFAWDELKKLARTNLDAAREAPHQYAQQLPGLPQVPRHRRI